MSIQANSMTTKADFGSAADKPTILKSTVSADTAEQEAAIESVPLAILNSL